jgi:hypothetical protein
MNKIAKRRNYHGFLIVVEHSGDSSFFHYRILDVENSEGEEVEEVETGTGYENAADAYHDAKLSVQYINFRAAEQ